MALLAILVFIAVALTWVMFSTRQAMRGMACALFWALAGAQSYTLSAATWDIHFTFAFASLLGMTTFCVLGAFGLREKRDSIGDMGMERGDGDFIGEKRGVGKENQYMRERKGRDIRNVSPNKEEEEEDDFTKAARLSRGTGSRRASKVRKSEFD